MYNKILKFKNIYIGDKKFYKMILILAVPIMIQNGITNFVNLLDNIMVGRIGTYEMTSVSIINQLVFIFNLAVFGVSSGAGIFTSQYYGKGDYKTVKHTLQFKIIATTLVSFLFIILFMLFNSEMISLYIKGEQSEFAINQTMKFAKDYLYIILWGLVPFGIIQAYSSTLRETSETKLPMIASTVAVITNLIFNYILIFGNFGFPALGVKGAGIATVISRFVEMFYIVIWTHTHKEKNPFAVDIFKNINIPKHLSKDMIIKGIPLTLNETLWGLGMATYTQCYSLRGLNVVSALNIANTINDLCNITFISLGSVIAILLGQLLGANKTKEALSTSKKLIFTSMVISLFIGIFIMLPISGIFPQIYNTTDEIKKLATNLIRIYSFAIIIHAYLHSIYFTLRSGGNTLITFIFDSAFMWAISLPIIFILSKFTEIPMIYLFVVCQLIDTIKILIGKTMLKQGKWINNLTK